MLALVILVKGVRRLIATIALFTVAHSLTLVAATLGWVRVPGPPVEAAIALSIMFVAAEIVHSRQGMNGLTEKFPWIVAFTFGLLHGFGFASALSEVGLPQTAIPVALLFFNVGVEIGRPFLIAFVFAVIALARQVLQRFAMTQLMDLASSSVCHWQRRGILGHSANRGVLTVLACLQKSPRARADA